MFIEGNNLKKLVMIDILFEIIIENVLQYLQCIVKGEVIQEIDLDIWEM